MRYEVDFGRKYHILLNLTYRCQNSCPECWEVLMGRDAKTTPFNVPETPLSEWVRTLNRLPPSVLDISGGEPTLYDGFTPLVNTLRREHVLALSTNLRGDAVKKILGYKKQFVGVNCSWHRGQGLPLDTFISRVKTLLEHGVNASVNIVDHPTSLDHEAKRILEENNIKVYVNPFEDPKQLRLTSKTLRCNAGLNTFTIDPSGNVYRCLTWFRYEGRDRAYLGNLINGTFKPLPRARTCNLSCDIYYVLDPLHNHKHMFSTRVEEHEPVAQGG